MTAPEPCEACDHDFDFNGVCKKCGERGLVIIQKLHALIAALRKERDQARAERDSLRAALRDLYETSKGELYKGDPMNRDALSSARRALEGK